MMPEGPPMMPQSIVVQVPVPMPMMAAGPEEGEGPPMLPESPEEPPEQPMPEPPMMPQTIVVEMPVPMPPEPPPEPPMLPTDITASVDKVASWMGMDAKETDSVKGLIARTSTERLLLLGLSEFVNKKPKPGFFKLERTDANFLVFLNVICYLPDVSKTDDDDDDDENKDQKKKQHKHKRRS